MDRARFEYLLDAYGADFDRWPSEERAAAIVFAQDHAETAGPLLAGAHALDATLNLARSQVSPSAALSARILEAARRASSEGRAPNFSRAGWALAACTLLGVIIGYGGGALAAPSADQDEYFAAAFEAPPAINDAGDPG